MKNELEFYNSDNLLNYINSNVDQYSKPLLDELNRDFHSLSREVVRIASWPSDSYILYLVNKLDIRVYSVKYYSFGSNVYLNKTFECKNKLYSTQILQKCPFPESSLIKYENSLNFCTEEEAYELLLWSIAAEKMKNRMYESEGEIVLEFHKKSFNTNSNNFSYISTWDLTNYNIEINGSEVKFQSDFERCLGREAYREIEIKSIFNLQTGGYELIDYQKGYWNYK